MYIVGTLQTKYPRVQAPNYGEKQDVQQRTAT
jgi:hypothetical protein